MNLETLKATVAAYHQKEVAELTQNSVDLFLVAVNNARKNAEKLHSFESSRCTAKLDIDGVLGGKLSNAILEPPDAFSKVKEVIGASILRANGFYMPIDFSRADIEKERERSALELDAEYWPPVRYPSDSQILWSQGFTKLVQRGDSLYLFPEPKACTNTTGCEKINVKLECYGYLRDYTAADLENPQEFDWFLEHGDVFLQWSAIHDLNHIYQTYVPRQEGNVVTSPKDMRDEAWRDLQLWDSYRVDSYITRTK